MRGEKEFKRHQMGERLTLRQMILAHCYDCMGRYADGKIDCKIPECPLYPRMPYREGGVLPLKQCRVLTASERKTAADHLQRGREKKREGKTNPSL